MIDSAFLTRRVVALEVALLSIKNSVSISRFSVQIRQYYNHNLHT